MAEAKKDVIYKCPCCFNRFIDVVIDKDENGVYRYKLVDGKIIERTEEEKKLENFYGNFGAALAYDEYTDTLYLFEDQGNETIIYVVDANFDITHIAELDSRSVHIWDMRIADCNFFSDGIMHSMMLDNELVDSNTWNSMGEGPYANAIINDKMYELTYNYDNDSYTSIKEIDFQENTIETYPIPEKLESDYYYYSNKDYLYILGRSDKKQYVYCFDGDEWKEFACLSDYKYFTVIYHEEFCVTDNVIWIYDRMTKTIKEFELN